MKNTQTKTEVYRRMMDQGYITGYDFNSEDGRGFLIDLLAQWRKKNLTRVHIMRCSLPSDLLHVNLDRIYFTGCDFTGVVFHHGYMCDTIFKSCDLKNAIFNWSNLHGVKFSDCNFLNNSFARAGHKLLTVQFWNCLGVLDAGQDARGYRFLAFRNETHGYMVSAGCHWMKRQDAIEHWYAGSYTPSLMKTNMPMDDCVFLTRQKIYHLDNTAYCLGWADNYVYINERGQYEYRT